MGQMFFGSGPVFIQDFEATTELRREYDHYSRLLLPAPDRTYIWTYRGLCVFRVVFDGAEYEEISRERIRER